MQVGYSQQSMCFCQRWSQSYANILKAENTEGLVTGKWWKRPYNAQTRQHITTYRLWDVSLTLYT